MFAALLLTAEHDYARGWREHDLARLTAAGTIGATKYWLRQGPARAAIAWSAPPEIALPTIGFSLRHNPHSADLLAIQMKYRLRAGDPRGAAQSFKSLHRLVPNTPSVTALCGNDPVCDVKFVIGESK